MSDTVKLIIEIPKETKQAFDKAESNDFKISFYDHGGIIGKAIQNGTPLDSCLDRAELKAYFDGVGVGWKEGREDLLDDVKAEIDKQYDRIRPYNIDVANGLEMALEILDNIGKAESEET